MDIVISELTKSYNQKLVLDKFSCVFRQNERTFIMGPSGCGKTTLINIIMGLIPYDSGIIKGIPAYKSAVFQEDRLCETFNAISNVRLVCDKKIKDQDIISHLESIGLKGDLSKPVNVLSGGMRRRVAIVRAILSKSDIIFFDEPFKGLDIETKKNAMDYLVENTINKTTIIITHDIDEVKALGGELISMDVIS